VRAAVAWRYLTVAVALSAILATVGLVGPGKLKVILLPVAESNNVVAFVTMPREAAPEQTAAAVAILERPAGELRSDLASMRGRDQLRHILVSVGEHPFREFQGGPMDAGTGRQGDFLREGNGCLIPSDERTMSSEEIAALWRDRLGPLPGVVELEIQYDLISGGKDIDLQLSAPDRAFCSRPPEPPSGSWRAIRGSAGFPTPTAPASRSWSWPSGRMASPWD